MIVPIMPAGQPNDIGTQTSFANAVLPSFRICIVRMLGYRQVA